MTIIYIRIQSICQERGISLNALEKSAGLTRNSIQKWKNALPLSSNVLAVANYLDVSVDYLLGNTDDPQSHKSDSTKVLETLSSIRSFVDLKIAETQQKDLGSSEAIPLEPVQDKK